MSNTLERLFGLKVFKNGEDFVIWDKPIAEGGFSKVKFALHDARVLACKIIPKNEFIGRISTESLAKEEIKINQQLDHDGILKMVKNAEDFDNIYIFTEYEKNGTVLNLIEKYGKLDENLALDIFVQLIKVLLYMKQKGICHRDIKADNLLIDRFFRIKLCDFGCSEFVDDHNFVHGSRGTPYYMSPECIGDKSDYDGFASDAWSCGVLLYHMLVGTYPFKSCSTIDELKNKIQHDECKFPDFINEEVKTLINWLLEKDPKKRLTLEKAASFIS